MANKLIKVDYLARVEGEGSLLLRFQDKQVKEVQLKIFEPPRFFEAFLQGRAQEEVPDITARICGICPVAYQMSSCHAIEDILGLSVGGQLRELRRLLYCGEWIESHTLHVFMLHAPDFLGYPDALTMAKDHPEVVKRSLRMKKAGNAIVSVLGGREIHPINVKVGGFYRSPSVAELRALLPELRWSLGAAQESVVWLSRLTFPELTRDYEYVSLRHPNEYPFNEGRVVSSKGLDIDVHQYEEHFQEEQVPHSNALHSRKVGGGPYLCGPLARIHLNFEKLSRAAKDVALSVGFQPPCVNPFQSIIARMVEVTFAFEEAIRIIESYVPPAPAALSYTPKAGVGCAATEAPRGLLYHRYRVDEQGIVKEAKIVAPTSQNQASIEEDLRLLGPSLLDMPHMKATELAEQAVRNHDPCISCATHFLKLKIEQS